MDNELEVISAEAVVANLMSPLSFVCLRGTEEDRGLRRVRLDNSSAGIRRQHLQLRPSWWPLHCRFHHKIPICIYYYYYYYYYYYSDTSANEVNSFRNHIR